MNIPTSKIATTLRDIAPWVAAALGLQIGLHVVWPRQVASALSDRARTQTLRHVVPDERALRTRVDSLRADSLRIASRLQLARSRQISGSDPAALLATRIVPLLGGQGWKLDRVKAESNGGYAILDLGASADFAQALQGLREIGQQPLSVKIRRLAMRPGPSGRLSVDLQVAVPATGAP